MSDKIFFWHQQDNPYEKYKYSEWVFFSVAANDIGWLLYMKQQNVLGLVEKNPAKTVNSYMYIVVKTGSGHIFNHVTIEKEQRIIA